jgi:hypothetical protein
VIETARVSAMLAWLTPLERKRALNGLELLANARHLGRGRRVLARRHGTNAAYVLGGIIAATISGGLLFAPFGLRF